MNRTVVLTHLFCSSGFRAPSASFKHGTFTPNFAVTARTPATPEHEAMKDVLEKEKT
jgi:hypothetical protein